ncbi:uncharacterized protein LOC119091199, partial [Pollicipes pollicipes]|uniref:uncharacterized protein LOC119091199 n=1 Tax=Pollicipes pollicipes TaxID=41117 RepID=UPI001884FBC1
MEVGPFDARLIPEYDGSSDAVEWFTRAAALCRHRGVDLTGVLPARLTGGAFAAWLRMPEASQDSVDAVRDALYDAFTMDRLAAYDDYASRRLQPTSDGKRVGGRRVSASAVSSPLRGALPITRLEVNGRMVSVLVDTGCTDTLVHAGHCAQWTPRMVQMATINGQELRCCGTGSIVINTTDRRVTLEVLVVPGRPLCVDVVLGMNGITALGGISVRTPTDVRFYGAAAVTQRGLEVDAADLTARFSGKKQAWTVAWEWKDGTGPECLHNVVAEYPVPADARQAYDAEIDAWISNGWLMPYDKQVDGPPRGLVPLMAVRQANQDKVRPVLGYRELNSFVTAHTVDADVCADQPRKWRRQGTRVTVVDLCRAHLQLRLERRLWPYRTVMVRGQRYCLTRLGFGLNVAPLIIKAVFRAVLAEDADMQRAVLPYVDGLLVDENIMSADRVVRHFARFGLAYKAPERVADGARLLGLRVQLVERKLHWSRDNGVAAPPEEVTRRAVGWLRPAVAWLKLRVNAVMRGSDDATTDVALLSQISQTADRLKTNDPAHGPWSLTGEKVIVWTDASAIAADVVIESPDDGAVEDACWLRPETTMSAHTNMAELDEAVRGTNLAIAWGMQIIDLRTDSDAVHRWIDDALSGRACLRTKAHGEMLIRRRMDAIRQLVDELSLTLGGSRWCGSDGNRADTLTRVPKEWLRGTQVDDDVPVRILARTGGAGAVGRGKSMRIGSRAAAAAVHDGADAAKGGDSMDIEARIMAAQESAGHPGIRQTLYF